jgi:hypothetical protein
MAEAAGMSATDKGAYLLRDGSGRALFTLSARGDKPAIAGAYLTGLSLTLDLPRTPAPVQSFDRMFQLGLQLADTLHGELVDDNGLLLTSIGRKQIAESIAQTVSGMEARGIVPGGSVALRLYA